MHKMLRGLSRAESWRQRNSSHAKSLDQKKVNRADMHISCGFPFARNIDIKFRLPRDFLHVYQVLPVHLFQSFALFFRHFCHVPNSQLIFQNKIFFHRPSKKAPGGAHRSLCFFVHLLLDIPYKLVFYGDNLRPKPHAKPSDQTSE